jgi:gliding motility-associated-like protein
MNEEKSAPKAMRALVSLLLNLKKCGFFFLVTLCLQLVTVNAHAQFTKLFDFGGNINGTKPHSTPISDGTFLYAMTTEGGTNNLGTIFKIKLDGTGITVLLNFDGANGANPFGSLYYDGSFLYGMTKAGGTNAQGTIFKIKPDGTAFTKMFDFSFSSSGGFPLGSLISDGTFLYGMTSAGGSKAYGTVFKILPDGNGFATLLEFDYTTNGGYPYGSLILDGGFLFGMTNLGVNNDLGTIFKVRTDGTGYDNLFDFTLANGYRPFGSLYSDGAFLYGMTTGGGTSGLGTIFKIQTDGIGFVTLFNFSNATGGTPKGSLVSDGTSFYGTTTNSGAIGGGTIFKINPNGTGFLVLADASGSTTGPNPEGTLLYEGTTLYGMKSAGGTSFRGNIFKINRDGSGGLSNLFNFEIEGNNPNGSLFSDGTFLYGTTSKGGAYDKGTIFKVRPDGTAFSRLFDFDDSNGAAPNGSLVSDGTFLYGMTSQGGINLFGTIFKIRHDGTGFAKLFDFDLTNGVSPNGSLISIGTVLYGMTSNSGTGGSGALFKINTNGTGFTNLLDFNGPNGGYPKGSLISDGMFLYGLTAGGGTLGFGTVFKIRPDGTGFATLHEFDYDNGYDPQGSLALNGAVLYGMSYQGGANDDGTIFKIKTDGTGFATLFNFDFPSSSGGGPKGSLLFEGTNLFGMTLGGGLFGSGNIFKIKPDGIGYANLFDFGDLNGSNPTGSPISDGLFLYGLTEGGGAKGLGTLFKRSLAPATAITNFIPEEGVEGKLITINGVDFNPTPAGNLVDFNGTIATVISSTDSQLTVRVPVGASSGPISVTAIGTSVSPNDFILTTESVMTNGSIKNCNVVFLEPFVPADYSDVIETFLPINPSDKVKISFSMFNLDSDVLYVYDGPNTSSPLVATLTGVSLPSDIVATGAGGELTFRWEWQDGGSDWNATISCVSLAPTITITTQPSNFIACVGQTATFSTAATGTTNIAYQWQYSTTLTGTYADITNGPGYSNVATATLSVNTTGNFGAGFYRCKVDGDLAATVFSNAAQLTVSAIPTAPTTLGASACVSGSVIVNASGGSNGQYRWYNAATGGTAIAGETNSTYTTPVLSANTNYFVSINNGTCESARTQVTATIITVAPPTITGASACAGNTFTLTASGGTNGQYRWYTTATGGIAIVGEVNGSYTTPPLTASTNYFVSITIGTCESTRTPVTATIITAGCNPVITPTPLATQVDGKIILDLKPLITTVGTLDVNSIKVIVQPNLSGATASIANGILTIDYSGKTFSGNETIRIEACNTLGACSQTDFEIKVDGEIVVYNALSANDDILNATFHIQNIGALPETKTNRVVIFNRWGDVVFDVENYDNTTKVFRGLSNDGKELPSGIYFYKVTFSSGAKTMDGFISLKK